MLSDLDGWYVKMRVSISGRLTRDRRTLGFAYCEPSLNYRSLLMGSSGTRSWRTIVDLKVYLSPRTDGQNG